MTGAWVNVNGEIVEGGRAVISVFDHGFLFGEGVYEVCRTYHGTPFLLDRHLARLRASAAGLALDVPFADEEIQRRTEATMVAAGLGLRGQAAAREAYLRIVLTRGVGEITYDPAATPEPSLVIISRPHVDPPAWYYTRGVAVALLDIVRNHPQAVSPLIKSNNLLNNALAMQAAIRRGAVEGVLRNYRGEIAECAQSNLFVVAGGHIRTPGLEAGLLAGITRAFVIEIAAALGHPVEEAVLHDADLLNADEAFLTSTTKEIVPIVRVDDRTLGSGRPGPVTQALLAEYRRRAHAATAPRAPAARP